MSCFSRLSLLAAVFLLTAMPAKGDVDISGYASFVAGKVTRGDKFLADYPKAGVYDNSWSFSPDTSIGVQLKSKLADDLELIIQAVSNGASGYNVELDWAYLNYQLNEEVSVQAGRKRLPLYYYSDFLDVGYAYYWIRPPADNYTWQITSFNGLSVQYQPYMDKWDALFSLYAGREDSSNNDLLSLLFGVPVDETWKNMVGGVAELSNDWLDFRATFMQGQLDRTADGVVTDKNIKQQFSGFSFNMYYHDFIVLSELNHYIRDASNIHVVTNMISLAYQFGDFTPHITRSEFVQKKSAVGGDEQHHTLSVGLKWDWSQNTILKVQYDKVTDKGVVIPVLGDSESISLGVDIVF